MSKQINETDTPKVTSVAEKVLSLARKAVMADGAAAEYSLRARGKPDSRPLASLTNKERGLKAAIQVLKGDLAHRARHGAGALSKGCSSLRCLSLIHI